MTYRWQVDSTIAVHRERPAKRYMIATLGGYFPVLLKLGDGSLAVVFRTGDFHVGERGRLEIADSRDGGETWGPARAVVAEGSDARNPAFFQASDGSLLVAFVRAAYANGQFMRTQGYDVVYLTRSRDGGRRWTAPKAINTSGIQAGHRSPYGKMTAMPDGTVLMNVYGGAPVTSYVLRSRDGGATWGDPSVVMAGGDETALLCLPSGALLAMVRAPLPTGEGQCLWQTRSEDGGYTWGRPRQLTLDTQIPGDLLLLRDGRVLLTYGHRTSPFGVRGLVSRDDGEAWDHDSELVLVADCVRSDCGYPSSVQLDDGRIITAYYTYESAGPFRHGVPQYGMFMGPHCAGVTYGPDDLP